MLRQYLHSSPREKKEICINITIIIIRVSRARPAMGNRAQKQGSVRRTDASFAVDAKGVKIETFNVELKKD